MNVAVFGLGYVGSVTAACLAASGHRVIGIDVSAEKTDALANGRAPVQEPGLDDLLAECVRTGALTATQDAEAAIATCDVSLVCVGTPSTPSGSLGTDALERVAMTIGSLLGKAESRHTVVVRSTVIPGTTETLVVPLLEEHSGLVAGRDFGVAVNPEFLREGSSVADFNDPARTIVGELDEASGEQVLALYSGLPGEKFRVSIRTAEMIKYADNSFHAVKVTFANEIGNFCSAAGIDAHEVMSLVKSDTKLNVSTAYLSPGFAFGGSCLPKDLRALVHAAGRLDLELPMLGSVLTSNEGQVARVVEIVRQSGARKVALFGIAFKPGTDDLRESPLVELAERLHGKGFDLKIYDPNIALSELVGSNLSYVDAHLPHLSKLLVTSADEAFAHAEICVVGSRLPETLALLEQDASKPVVDLVHLPDAISKRQEGSYFSVTW